MRRANLNLVPLIERFGGYAITTSLNKVLRLYRDRVIIVDSTRRGKRFPDALSKTVPTWCCVINRATKARWNLKHFEDKLYTPPIAVSRSEHVQIENGLEAWTQSLLVGLILYKYLKYFFIRFRRVLLLRLLRCPNPFGLYGFRLLLPCMA